VLVAAALCPWPPVLARELTGLDPVVATLRDACAMTAGRLVRAAPELIVVVGPAAVTRTWDPGARLDLSVFAPGLAGAGGSAGGTTGDPALPPALGLGARLLDQAEYPGARVLQAVSEHESADRCAELGAQIAASAPRVGLLAMGDGSARRRRTAPGHFDERAAAFDAGTERALRAGNLPALLAISPGLARELMATGRPAWQVLAGAVGPASDPARPATEILYNDDPFGVAYLVAYLRVGG
jgi:hypothetical protein